MRILSWRATGFCWSFLVMGNGLYAKFLGGGDYDAAAEASIYQLVAVLALYFFAKPLSSRGHIVRPAPPRRRPMTSAPPPLSNRHG